MVTIRLNRALLDEVVAVLDGLAEDSSYGVSVLCDDPRDFHPDPECCTPAEMAAHADACRRAEAGETVEIPRHRYQTFGSPDEASAYMKAHPEVGAITFAGAGKPSHVNVQTWGMGTSVVRDRKLADLRDRLLAAIGSAS